MGRTFSSINEFKEFLLDKCEGAVDSVKDEVYDKFREKLGQFYSEFTPEEYIRTGALNASLNQEGAYSTGNGARASVFFIAPSYAQGLVPLQSGGYGWATWSGEQVLGTALHGSHGGYVEGTAIWDEALIELGDIRGKLRDAMGL